VDVARGTAAQTSAPAFTKLQEMRFANVKLLYLADDFGVNWVNKGYPIEQGR
jgi:hypothetical protein